LLRNALKIRVLRLQPCTCPAAHVSGADPLRDDAFQVHPARMTKDGGAGFKDVGIAEGDLIFEDRFWNSASRGSLERLDLLAKQLVDLKCDVLIGVAIASALALRRHTSTIPIVFVYNPNPAGSGLVKSLNHPGGNVTGVTQVHVDLAAKRVELEVHPVSTGHRH